MIMEGSELFFLFSVMLDTFIQAILGSLTMAQKDNLYR
jgi:hypothetical protein